jgi:hypothetical protein
LLKFDAMVGSAGGVLGRTVVVAAVGVVVVPAISDGGGCCSSIGVAKLMRYWFDDGDCRYRGWEEESSFGGVGGQLIFS